MSRSSVVRMLCVLVPLVVGGCQAGPTGNGGLEQVRIEADGTAPVRGDFATAALGFIEDSRDALDGLAQEDGFAVDGVQQGRDGLAHVRVRQQHRGVPVWGAGLVVHSSPSGVRSLNGSYAKGLENLDVQPGVEAAAALQVARDDYSTRSDGSAELQFSRESSDLVVTTIAGNGAQLAWHVVFFTELQAGINPGLWNYFVDAHDGSILYMFNGIDTLSQASGPGGNAKVSREWVQQLDVEPYGSQYQMNTSRFYTTNMNHSTSGTGTVVTGPLDPIGDAPINDAHGFAEMTVDMMSDWLGYNSLNDNGLVIRSRVHYGTNYENAFWDGTQMTYGDGASTFYPLSGAIDVVAHEINHGFTEYHSNLTYSGISGGLNESFSDIAGKMAEFYYKGDNTSWDLGADIFRSSSGALRYMCDPTADGYSIDNADDYYSGLDVHYSSGVMNKAFCRAAKRFASGSPTGQATAASVRRAGTAFYVANHDYWTASTGWTAACQGVMDAAAALGFTSSERAALLASWEDVGVTCDGGSLPPSCDVTYTSESGSFTSPNYPSNYPDNYSYTWCIQPASGSAATLTFDAFSTESGYDYVTITDASGAQLAHTSGTTAPAPATSTFLAITFASDQSVNSSGFSASWTTGGNPPPPDNEPPTVAITAPQNGSTVSGTVTITASASDSDGSVARVTLGLPGGGSVNLTSAPYTYAWDSTSVANGSAAITATAYDNDGAASSTATVNVTVDNGGGSGGCVDGTFNATDVPRSIPDYNSTGITSHIAVTGDGTVASLAISLNISHPYIGDLVVTLISPSGTRVVLFNRYGGSADNIVVNNAAVTGFAGQTAAGTWGLEVKDLARYDTGTLNSWSLNIVGDCGGGGGGDWYGYDDPDMYTQDYGTVCTSLYVSDSGDAADVQLDMYGYHTYRSILRGTLQHNGTQRTAFSTGTFSSGEGYFLMLDHVVSGFSGDAAGTWTLCITDTDGYGDVGILYEWAVHN